MGALEDLEQRIRTLELARQRTQTTRWVTLPAVDVVLKIGRHDSVDFSTDGQTYHSLPFVIDRHFPVLCVGMQFCHQNMLCTVVDVIDADGVHYGTPQDTPAAIATTSAEPPVPAIRTWEWAVGQMWDGRAVKATTGADSRVYAMIGGEIGYILGPGPAMGRMTREQYAYLLHRAPSKAWELVDCPTGVWLKEAKPVV